MKTTKPISTISYNTRDFLTFTLDGLVGAHKIAFYAFIRHLAEGDEKKDHYHLYIEPNGKIDTMDLQDMLKEIDPAQPDKPLKCVDWRSSKWEDWYFYGIHDPDYLKTKFETRKMQYSDDEIITGDLDELYVRIERARHSDIIKLSKINKYLEMGVSVNQMAFQGMILPAQSFAYRNYVDMYQRGRYESQKVECEVKEVFPELKKEDKEPAKRKIICNVCGKEDTPDKFNIYCGVGSENSGICAECCRSSLPKQEVFMFDLDDK